MTREQLAIELVGAHDRIPLASFLRVASDTLYLLKEIDVSLSRKPGGTLTWKITAASMRSPLIVQIEGEPRHETLETAANVADTYIEALRSIESGLQPPSFFDEIALQRAKSLSSVLNKEVARLRFIEPGRPPVAITQHLAANVDAALKTRKPYYEFTTLEGTLEVVSVHGQTSFSIFDPKTKARIMCIIPEEKLAEVTGMLRDRVQVYGKAKFKRSGTPVSISVDEIKKLRASEELPKFRAGEEIDITGGADSADLVRRIRDAE